MVVKIDRLQMHKLSVLVLISSWVYLLRYLPYFVQSSDKGVYLVSTTINKCVYPLLYLGTSVEPSYDQTCFSTIFLTMYRKATLISKKL